MGCEAILRFPQLTINTKIWPMAPRTGESCEEFIFEARRLRPAENVIVHLFSIHIISISL